MSFIGNAIATIGSSIIQGAAADKAADKQAAVLRDAEATSRADLQPYRQAGEEALPGYKELATSPEAQKKYVTENPFFTALADEVQKRLFQNQAARGKVGSGGTAEALQKSILLLGESLVNTGVERQRGIVTLGANAAAKQANVTQQTGATVADVEGQRIAGITDAITGGISDLVKLKTYSGGVKI